MAIRAVNTPNQEQQAEPIPPCPICEGAMFVAYDRYQQKVCVCTDCHTSVTIPGSAWQVGMLKREARKIDRAPERRRVARRAADIRMDS